MTLCCLCRTDKKSLCSSSREDKWSEGESNSASNWTDCCKSAPTDEQDPLNHSKTRFQTPAPTYHISETSEAVSGDQDQPLSFDRTRLAVAAAAFRGPSVQLGSSQTQTLARVLQSGLPNLSNCAPEQTLQSRYTETNEGASSGVGKEQKSNCEEAESSDTRTTEEQTGHVLGLDCYSSSDEDWDT